MSWDIEKSKDLYQMDEWSDGFFGINNSGNVCFYPEKSQKNSVDLVQIIKKLKLRGIADPLLLRFTNIIDSRIELISSCFSKAIKENKYKSKYFPAYPIKVNQEKHLLDHMITAGEKAGLYVECGSKPELLIALSLKKEGARIICNGFKDEDFIRLALYCQKLGHQIFIIIDRFSELEHVLKIATELRVKPKLGLRFKLNSSNKGHWGCSLGHHAKFGLSADELVKSLQLFKKYKMMDCLNIAHFHPGSQVSSMLALKSAFREGAYLFCELYKAGAKHLKYLDIGGGLGVHYGSTDHKVGSVDYSEAEYASDVIYTLKTICDEKKVPHPHVISESGRALVAHSSLLAVNCWDSNSNYVRGKSNLRVPKNAHRVIQEMHRFLKDLNKDAINESYHDLIEKKEEFTKLFSYGQITLEEKALGEQLYWDIATRIYNLAKEDTEEYHSIYSQLKKELKDTYFGNFSIFQSLPDLWALDQPFPVTPLQKLDKEPDRWAQIVDLTCDSDGRIDHFIDRPGESGVDIDYLPVHKINKNQNYYLGIFLTGAYQEILGDLHNLFGDVNAVHITVDKKGSWEVEDFVIGDSNEDILKYVSYNPSSLKESLRFQVEKALKKKKIQLKDLKNITEIYEKTLLKNTYLD